MKISTVFVALLMLVASSYATFAAPRFVGGGSSGQTYSYQGNGNILATRCVEAFSSTGAGYSTCGSLSGGAAEHTAHSVATRQVVVGWDCFVAVKAGGGSGDTFTLGPARESWVNGTSFANAQLDGGSCDDAIDLNRAAPFLHSFTCPTPIPIGAGSDEQTGGVTLLKLRGVVVETAADVTDLEMLCAIRTR